MIRSTCLLVFLPCLVLVGCQRDNPTPPPASQSAPAQASTEAPPQATAPTAPKTESEIIHKWRLSNTDKYTCPSGYRQEIVPHKERQPGKPLIRCRSIANPSLPPKPATIKSP